MMGYSNAIFFLIVAALVASVALLLFSSGNYQESLDEILDVEQAKQVQPPEEISLPEQFELILPVRKDEVMNTWPFGVRGGDHPFGHPGIDFEAPVGAEILAAASGRISHIGDSGFYDQKTFNIHVATHDIIYTGSVNVVVSEDQEVNQGDVIANMEAWLGEGETGWLHFEVQKNPSREVLCPAEFFTEEAGEEINELHDASTYQEREDFPLVCNPCPDGGCR